MKTETLTRMANQMASFFRAYPEEEAATGIRKHIVAFWTPGMRSQFRDFAREDGTGLDPLVAKAMLGWGGWGWGGGRLWPPGGGGARAPAAASGQGASDAG